MIGLRWDLNLNYHLKLLYSRPGSRKLYDINSNYLLKRPHHRLKLWN
jgi:hypothetical protein